MGSCIRFGVDAWIIYYGIVVRFALGDFATNQTSDLEAKDPALKGFESGFREGIRGYKLPFTNGSVEVLDLAATGYVDPHTALKHLDVVLVATATATAEGPARHLERRAAQKHRRYPGADMVPFIVDVPGRWGVEVQIWSRGAARTAAGQAIADLRWRLAKALSPNVAEQRYRSTWVSRRTGGSTNAGAAAAIGLAVPRFPAAVEDRVLVESTF